MTQSEQLDSYSSSMNPRATVGCGGDPSFIPMDYQSPVKVRWMRQAFTFLGTEWNDIGKANTGLNFILSSPLFRHALD